MATRKGGSPGQQKAPPGAMEMLIDLHQRAIRIETRLTRFMAAMGFDSEGHQIASEESAGSGEPPTTNVK
jgi:hypothetical protein